MRLKLQPPGIGPRRLALASVRERVQRMTGTGSPLCNVLMLLASAAEVASDGRTVSSILLMDREGLLRNGASPNLPANYLDAIDRLKPDPEVGTCAAAAATGEVVITPSFKQDRRWSTLKHLPLALGFLGAWSMPIKNSAGRVIGTFGTYFREEREPTSEERAIIAFLVDLAGAAIETNPT
jgi:GAF domain-containing protein